ncbi:MAG: TetR-like C-terminal domain-containing protein [Actinomycetota bacterium]
MADALQETFERESAFPITDDPIGDLRTQMAAAAMVMRSPAGAMIRELLADAQTDSETLDMFRKRFFERRREQARQAIERGVASGALRADLDSATVIDLLYAPIWLRLLTGHGSLTEPAIDRIIDTALAGIAAFSAD